MSNCVLRARINSWPISSQPWYRTRRLITNTATGPNPMPDHFKFSNRKQYGHLRHRNLRHRCGVWHTAVVAMRSVLVWQHYECIRSLNKEYITHLQISVCYNMPSLLFSVSIRTDIDKSADITCTMQTSHKLYRIINCVSCNHRPQNNVK